MLIEAGMAIKYDGGKKTHNINGVIQLMNKPLTFLLSLTFLFLFSYGGECNSKTSHLNNNNYFSSFEVEGLGRNDSRHLIEYERSF